MPWSSDSAAEGWGWRRGSSPLLFWFFLRAWVVSTLTFLLSDVLLASPFVVALLFLDGIVEYVARTFGLCVFFHDGLDEIRPTGSRCRGPRGEDVHARRRDDNNHREEDIDEGTLLLVNNGLPVLPTNLCTYLHTKDN